MMPANSAALLLALLSVPCASFKSRLLDAKHSLDTFTLDDPCWVFIMPCRQCQEIPKKRVPCRVVGADAAKRRYNVSLVPRRPFGRELLEVPAHSMKKVEPHEYVAAAHVFGTNKTLAFLAAQLLVADDAKRQWLAKSRAEGRLKVQDEKSRGHFLREMGGVWEDAYQKFAQEAAEAAEAAAKQTEEPLQAAERERGERQRSREEQVRSIDQRLKIRQSESKRRDLLALAQSLRMAQESDDLEAQEEAHRRARMTANLSPGLFRVRLDGTQVLKSERPGSEIVAGLDAGTLVNVTVISNWEEDARVRGLIESPLGWVSLFHKSNQLYFVEPVGEQVRI